MSAVNAESGSRNSIQIDTPSMQGAEILTWIASLDQSDYPNWFRPKNATCPRLCSWGETRRDTGWRPSGLLRALNWLSNDRQRSMLSALRGDLPWGCLKGHRLSEAFRRSTLAPDIYFVDWRYEVEVMAMGELLSGGCWWSEASASPVNASAFEFQAQFLDGGVSHFAGDYFVGLKGTWVHGMRAVRLLCHELGLPRPPLRRFEEAVPEIDDLWTDLLTDRLDLGAMNELRSLGLVRPC